jgi:uncharacterized secreted protein with C-terminal beta-propeller domain
MIATSAALVNSYVRTGTVMLGGINGSCVIALPAMKITNNVVSTTTKTIQVKPEQVYHSNVQDSSGQAFTSIISLDTSRPTITPSVNTFLIGTSGTIYASLKNIFLTQSSMSMTDTTVVHRISLNNGNATYMTTGSVPGTPLNQFSMDEYNGYFRIATSGYGTVTMGSSRFSMMGYSTNLYVLDNSLKVVGKIEGLAQGEKFHSARFMNDRAYLVTFKKTDPLFVIDLSNPTMPSVLGELQVNGYSDYLQPYDQTHLIGIGKDTVDEGSFAYYQGVKISLFDVSDTAHPKEIGNYVIGARGSDSPALNDHKAVLFDYSMNLLVIPVSVAPASMLGASPFQYNTITWQGAYVFKISLNGIMFRGGITHLPLGETPVWNNQNGWITRSLYIGNVLYTISNTMVKMNSLDNLNELSTVLL